jgi:hypothetical protein
LNVSEQQAEQTSGESGAGEAAPKVSAGGNPFGTTAPAAAKVESPRIAPDQEETAPKPDVLKIEAVKAQPAKPEAAKIAASKPEVTKLSALTAEAPKFEAPKFETPKAEAPRFEALRVDAPKGEAPRIEVPRVEPAKAGTPKIEAVKAEAPKGGVAKVETAKVSSAKVETLKVDAAKAGGVKPEARRFSAKPTGPTIMSPGERSWGRKGGEAEAEAEPASPTSGKRRIGAMAAVLVLAAAAGAVGGALATTGFNHFTAVAAGAGAATSASDPALEASVARIDADLAALKAGLDDANKTGMTQYNTTNDRLDKIEQTLAEPASKLAKFNDAVDKMGTAPPDTAAAEPAAAPAPPPKKEREVTGSVTTRAVTASITPAPAAVPKPQIARLPTLEGWVLRDVRRGGALIEGRAGLYEVYAGDPVPGLGRVDAIRKQDGRWVVVTTKGLVVAR